MISLKQKISYRIITVILLVGVSVNLQVGYVYAQTNLKFSPETTPHICATQADCDALNSGAGLSGTLNSQNAPHVYPSGQSNTQNSAKGDSNSGSQKCYKTVEEYVNATPNLGNFDEPLCAGVGGSSSSMNTFDTSNQSTDNKNLGDGSAPNGFRPLDSSIQLPAGIEKSTDMVALKAKLTDTTILLRVEDTTSGQPQWAIVPKSSVQGFENYYREIVSPNMNTLSDSNWMVARIIGSAAAEIGLTGFVTNLRVNSNSEFVQANGSNYDTYNSIINYATSLSGQSETNIEKIFDNVQQTIVPDSAADNYSMAQALECGIGVCRHQAAVLANALATDGYNSSIVFDADHAWVRVNYGGQTFDLDPTNYSFVKLPPRNTSSKYQVIPITPVTKPHGFLWPIVLTAYASTDVITPPSNNTATSTIEKKCGKIGVCVNIQLPAYVQANSSTTLEVWQAIGSDWSVTTFLKNPDIKMDFSNVQPITINILGQNRLAKEHTLTSNGHTIYALYSNFIGSNGEEIILQVLSNKSVVENHPLMTMIAGSGNVVLQPNPDNNHPTTAVSWPLVSIVGFSLLGVISSLIIIIRRHNKKSQKTF